MISSLLKGELRAFSELVSSGKSGSFFFYSVDGKYVLKTIRKDEFIFLRNILKEYHEHIKAKKNTLMPKFFSLNKIKFSNRRLKKELGFDQVYFVVMNNIFNKKSVVHERYDLKGSTYKREVFPNLNHGSPEDEFRLREITIAMKDLDFLKRIKHLTVTGTQKDHILDIIKDDCDFFARQGIIDYSLLVGVHYKNRADDADMQHKTTEEDFQFDEELPDFINHQDTSKCVTFDSPNGTERYLIGIIDILTPFNSMKKRMEYAIKRICVGNSISCIPPHPYANRFKDFMDQKVFKCPLREQTSPVAARQIPRFTLKLK